MPPVASPTKTVISANRLSDGAVVFVGRGNVWVESIDRARLFGHAEEAENCLAMARADEAANLVVDSYAFAVKSTGQKITPVALRDAIRASGPTIAWRGTI